MMEMKGEVLVGKFEMIFDKLFVFCREHILETQIVLLEWKEKVFFYKKFIIQKYFKLNHTIILLYDTQKLWQKYLN